MKLRIARKMDRGYWKRRALDDKDKRIWWQVYTSAQLDCAERRLRRAFHTHNPLMVDENGRAYRKTAPDWFAANRVHGRRIRQGAIWREVAAGRWKLRR